MDIQKDVKNYFILAEDDEDDRDFFKRAFDELPYSGDLRIAEDGFELMNFLEKPGIDLPKLILLDLNMPLINGFECLELMKKDERLRHIPVIVYSTSSNPDYVEKCYDLGAHYYVIKPSDTTELRQVIQHVIQTNWNGVKKERVRKSLLPTKKPPGTS